MAVTFLWQGDNRYDASAFETVHPNGDIYVATRRNGSPKSIVVTRIQSGTGAMSQVAELHENKDFTQAGPVDIALHPAGHIILVGTFLDLSTSDWSPGYIVIPNKIPPFNPNQNVTVVTSGQDNEARRVAQAAVDVANGAVAIANRSKAEVSVLGGNVERKATETVDGLVKKVDAAIAKLQGTTAQPANITQLVADTVWSKIPDALYLQIQDANSPLNNKITQTALAGDNVLRAEIVKLRATVDAQREELAHVSKYYYEEIEKLKAQIKK